MSSQLQFYSQKYPDKIHKMEIKSAFYCEFTHKSKAHIYGKKKNYKDQIKVIT